MRTRLALAAVIAVLAFALTGCGLRSGPAAVPAPPSPAVSTAAPGSAVTDPLAGLSADLSAVDGATQQATEDLSNGDAAAAQPDNG